MQFIRFVYGNVFYSSNTTAKPNIASFVRLPRQARPCSSLKNSAPNSTRVIVACRLLTKASISLLLIQISNDVESQPGPVAVRKGINICHWNLQHLTDSKFEEIRYLLTCPSKELFGLDILILSEDLLYRKNACNILQYSRLRSISKGQNREVRRWTLCVCKNSIQTKRRTDLETDGAVIIWLETCPYKSKTARYLLGEFTDLPHQRLVVIRALGKISRMSLFWVVK